MKSLFPNEATLGINTDLYELAMAAAYFTSGRAEDQVTFELFTRALPPYRSFLIAVGLEQALHYVKNVRFNQASIEYLRGLDTFKSVSDSFFEYLKDFRFTGDLSALPEGTPFFANEPILQVRAPVIEAQILETYLINTLNFQSMVASKAARICLAAKDKLIVDFGSRRAHSPHAGVLAARASFIGGCTGTSNVLAGYEMGLPVYGTMAHSFVQFFDRETEAFERFYDVYGEDSILLVDTYDTLEGVQKALKLGKIRGVRLDSGDLSATAARTRELLDKHGQEDARIIASGSLNEEMIRSLALADTPIDGYGVGTDLVVSTDAPTCDLVYKLVEVIRSGRPQPRIKASEGKATLPYRKQIHRRVKNNTFVADLLTRWDEAADTRPEEQTEALLQTYIREGDVVKDLPTVFEIKENALAQLSRLPTALKLLHTSEEYPVEHSKELEKVQKELQQEYV